MPPPTTITASNMRLLKSLYALPPSLRQSILLRPLTITSPLNHLQQHRHSSSHPSPNASNLPNPDQHPPTSRSQSTDPLIPPPKPNSGPLLSRLPNRALPIYTPGLSPTARLWLRTLPIFILLITLSSLSIFNYQKSSSSTVNSILYACRTSPTVRRLLGDEIYFASRIPWISGELNQLHGSINISFWIKGTKGQGKVRFVSVRKRRDGFFETLEWSLETGDGRVVQLLDVEGGRDPMGGRQAPQQLTPGQEGGIEL